MSNEEEIVNQIVKQERAATARLTAAHLAAEQQIERAAQAVQELVALAKEGGRQKGLDALTAEAAHAAAEADTLLIQAQEQAARLRAQVTSQITPITAFALEAVLTGSFPPEFGAAK